MKMLTLLLCIAALAPGCSDDDMALDAGGGGNDCTMRGCASGLAVTVKSAAGAAVKKYHGSATLDGASGSFTCTGAGGTSKGACSCGLDGTLTCQVLKPGKVQLEILSDEAKEKYKGEVTPTYKTTYPNGKGCAPSCHEAAIEVTLAAY